MKNIIGLINKNQQKKKIKAKEPYRQSEKNPKVKMDFNIKVTNIKKQLLVMIKQYLMQLVKIMNRSKMSFQVSDQIDKGFATAGTKQLRISCQEVKNNA